MSQRPNSPIAGYFVSFAVTANLFFVLLFLAFDMPQLADENNLMEDMQALVIAMAMTSFVWRGLRAAPAQRLSQWAAAWLSLSFLLRELDVESIAGLPSLLVYLGSGSARNSMLALGWLLILGLTLVHVHKTRPRLMQLLQGWLRSPAFLLMVAAALLLVLGEFFEKGLANWWAHVFFEELLEFNGYCCMVLSSLVGPAACARQRCLGREWPHSALQLH